MDAQTLHAAALAGIALALVFSIGSLVWASITWNLSRAGKLRAFERVMADNSANSLKRLEAIETRMIEYRAAMDSLVDQADELHQRSVKERKRVAQAEVRAGQPGPGPASPFAPTNDRATMLAAVSAHFNGMRE